MRVLWSACAAVWLAGASVGVLAEPAQGQSQSASVQLIRNATLKIQYAQQTFLVDPMLAPQGAYPGFANTYRSELRNPLVELPHSAEQVLEGVDAVIVTHTHLDHWDDAAQKLIPKNTPLFVQHQADAKLISSQGFTDVRVLKDSATFNNVTLHKTGGQHGTDGMYAIPELAQSLGQAMGVVLQAPNAPTLYIAGDTIWRKEVEQALADYQPKMVVLNAGYAQLTGIPGAIIMGQDDVLRAAQTAPEAKIVAVHLDAVNHMALSRQALKAFVAEQGIEKAVSIPEDGQVLPLY